MVRNHALPEDNLTEANQANEEFQDYAFLCQRGLNLLFQLISNYFERGRAERRLEKGGLSGNSLECIR
jgi:hypothetical protein